MAMEDIPHNFDVLYLRELGEQKETIQAAMLSGRPGSYEEYKFLVGQYRGLCVAENMFKDLVDKWNNR